MSGIGNRQQATGNRGKEARVIRYRLLPLISFLLLPQLVSAQAREKARVALGSISVNTSVIPIGQQAGLFSKHGIDLAPIYIGGGMKCLAAVTSSSVQF